MTGYIDFELALIPNQLGGNTAPVTGYSVLVYGYSEGSGHVRITRTVYSGPSRREAERAFDRERAARPQLQSYQ